MGSDYNPGHLYQPRTSWQPFLRTEWQISLSSQTVELCCSRMESTTQSTVQTKYTNHESYSELARCWCPLQTRVDSGAISGTPLRGSWTVSPPALQCGRYQATGMTKTPTTFEPYFTVAAAHRTRFVLPMVFCRGARPCTGTVCCTQWSPVTFTQEPLVLKPVRDCLQYTTHSTQPCFYLAFYISRF